MEHPGYGKMFSAGAEHNLALSFLMLPSDLPELDRMCTKFPETPIIIDHFCLIGRNMMFVEEEIDQLLKMARHKKVMLKIGAFYAFGQKTPPYLDMLPLIERVVDAFGPERCMFESNFPVDKVSFSYNVMYNAFKRLSKDYSASERAAMFHDTAARVYKIDV